MKVSLVFTVLNEAKSLSALLDTIAAQTRLPDEVVVCDGGSRDGTVALLRAESRLNVRVIESPGANISRGRNVAIAAASHEVIACTDAGVRLDPQWLEKLVEPLTIFSRDPHSDSRNGKRDRGDFGLPIEDEPNRQSKIENRKFVAAGFFLPDPHTTFEVAMSATVLPELPDINPETFLPSSRSVAFLKSAWQHVQGYPEWLDYCEDLIFDLKLRQAFGPLAFAPEAIAHFRPRGSLKAFFKQYYLYARGDGKAGLFLKRHLIRYATYLVVLPLLVAGMALGAPWVKLACVALLVAGIAAYTHTPYRRLQRLGRGLSLSAGEKLKAALLVPVIRVTGDLAKMCGYPVGVVWRLRRRQVKSGE
jgi:glycosyltransferase involved in cell wall biosynthesis